LDLGTINSYDSFFAHLTQHCKKEGSTYINWDCTVSKYKFFADIQRLWEELKQSLLLKANDSVTVNFMHFKTFILTTKAGKEVKHLTAISEPANLLLLTSFISDLLPKIIHHRNQLKHYRSTVKEMQDHFNTISIDIDFSENLSVPVKFEPQSLHWFHQQVTVHSGLLKNEGEKSYHAYLSDDRKHDQAFVKVVIEEMLEETNIENQEYIIIESDNCSSQYKSAAHFQDMKELSQKYNKTIIRVFGIAGHGKGEVDHVGGIAKVAVRREIAAGSFFSDAEEMVEFLQSKFHGNKSPEYFFKEIHVKRLETTRASAKLKKCSTVDGSSTFQVMLFQPDVDTIKAAPRLCLCEECKLDYGCCEIFTDYHLVVQDLNKVSLRSSFVQPMSEDHESHEDNHSADFLPPGTICAVAADDKSNDTVWFVKIVNELPLWKTSLMIMVTLFCLGKNVL